MDQIFSDSFGERAVFLKLEIAPGDPRFSGKLSRVDDNTLVYHSGSKVKLRYFLVFYGISSEEALAMAELAEKRVERMKVGSASRSILPEARAEMSPPCVISPQVEVPVAGAGNVVGRLEGFEAMNQAVMTCGRGMLQGAWDSTGGAAVALGKGAVDFFQDPVGSLRSLGPKMKQLWGVLSELNKKLETAWAGFKSLDAQTKAEVACGILGGLSADILLGVLTGGAASAKWALAMARISTTIEKLTRVEKLLHYFSRVKELAPLRQRFLRKIASQGADGISDASLGAIETISRHGFMDLATGAVRCAI